MEQRVPVLISGGSLVGLSAAAFLAWHGVPALLVERHPDTCVQPRAKAFNIRTVELLRQLGVEEEVRRCEPDGGMFANGSNVLRAHTLAGEEISWYEPTHAPTFRQGEVSPGRFLVCPQDLLEPIVCARARELGAEVRFGTEMAGFEQDGDGVRALLRDTATGETTTVHARYLIGADGNRSAIRRSLGIGTQGVGSFQHDVSALFDADLTEPLHGRRFFLCYIHHPEATGVLSTDGRRWLFSKSYRPDLGESPDSFTPQRCEQMIRTAVGVPDLDVNIVDVQSWSMSAWVADSMREGRVFLAGDSAHVCPPTGGFGANAGVQDAYDLAWKLAYVLDGRAGASLLDTYEQERLPVARFTVDQALARFAARNTTAQMPPGAVVPEVSHLAVTIGYRYRSAALPEDVREDREGREGREDREDRGAREHGQGQEPCELPGPPTGRPGTRVPHVWLERGGTRLSTLDLTGRHFTLLAGRDGGRWAEAAAAAAGRLGVDVGVHRIGADGLDDPSGTCMDAFGLDDAGAVLLRPDGFVAWRSPARDGDPDAEAHAALSRALGRDPGRDRDLVAAATG